VSTLRDGLPKLCRFHADRVGYGHFFEEEEVVGVGVGPIMTVLDIVIIV